MKNYAKFVLIFGIFMLAGIVAFLIISGKISDNISVSNEKMLILNDIVKDAEEKIDSPDSFEKKDYGVDFVVLDNNEKEVYKTQGAEDKIKGMIGENAIFTSDLAAKRRLLYKYVTKDERIVGTVILLDLPEDGLADFKLRFVLGVAAMSAVFIIGAVIYGVYIDKSIVKPFNRMQSFAGKVADGKLDEPLLMEENNMFGVFTESFDIMREELAESRKREIELQRKEKELIASLSHDLKTPITGIKLTTELLEAKLNKYINEPSDSSKSELKLNEDILDKLDNIYIKSDQIDSLVSDLFSASLEDLGEFKVNCVDEESAVLSEIIKKNDSKGMVVESTLPNLIIKIDRKRMSQVIGNIISNSYKYSGTKINVEYSIKEKFLEMKIKDYGPGVSRDELELITNKFYRGKKAEADNKEGSGLGLYIAKSLMVKMNGELICDSDDEGFSVTVLIPVS
ncbi:MAG: HAMP domain-containing histidine kinase [Lachnospiraceae bacterium]|nr:HAMP domain-containing histidine kinase [Lachnospiraceae bacterium]